MNKGGITCTLVGTEFTLKLKQVILKAVEYKPTKEEKEIERLKEENVLYEMHSELGGIM